MSIQAFWNNDFKQSQAWFSSYLGPVMEMFSTVIVLEMNIQNHCKSSNCQLPRRCEFTVKHLTEFTQKLSLQQVWCFHYFCHLLRMSENLGVGDFISILHKKQSRRNVRVEDQKMYQTHHQQSVHMCWPEHVRSFESCCFGCRAVFVCVLKTSLTCSWTIT